MPGMGDGININNPFVADEFCRSLQRHGLVALILAVALAAWMAWRRPNAIAVVAEPRSRRVLRTGFGLLWIVEGFLQMQSAMPLGLATNLLTDARDATPSFLRGPVNASITLWNEHPIGMATAAVLVELALGTLLLTRRSSAWGARFSVIWALMVFVASGYGGIFSPESSFFFGWPSSPVIYLFAGLVLRRRAHYFPRRFAHRATRWIAGVFLLGAIIQLRPGTGAWQSGKDNAFWQMSHDMASMGQWAWTRSLVQLVGRGAAAGGALFNIAMVALLLMLAYLVVRRGPRVSTLIVLQVASAAIWLGFQNTGLFGGLSTDPNSMPSLMVLIAAWWVALRTDTVGDEVTAPSHVVRTASRATMAIGIALALTGVFGWVTTALGRVETTFQVAANSQGSEVLTTAPPFQLRDLDGTRISVPSPQHRIVVLTFLDPVCYEECSTIGHQLRGLLSLYGSATPLEVVAVAANTKDHTEVQIRHFMSINGFDREPRFHFANGTTKDLTSVYENYGITVQTGGEDGMSIHTNVVYVIDRQGQLRYIMSDTPAPGQAGISSATQVLREVVDKLLAEK